MSSSAEKRPASSSFGSSQLVKRQRSDASLGGSSAVAIANGTGRNGALVQRVSLAPDLACDKGAELNPTREDRNWLMAGAIRDCAQADSLRP